MRTPEKFTRRKEKKTFPFEQKKSFYDVKQRH